MHVVRPECGLGVTQRRLEQRARLFRAGDALQRAREVIGAAERTLAEAAAALTVAAAPAQALVCHLRQMQVRFRLP